MERLIQHAADRSPPVPIMRVVDEMLTRSMAEYALTAALYYQRNLHHYAPPNRAPHGRR